VAADTERPDPRGNGDLDLEATALVARAVPDVVGGHVPADRQREVPDGHGDPDGTPGGVHDPASDLISTAEWDVSQVLDLPRLERAPSTRARNTTRGLDVDAVLTA
jgi:hypothetical protein